MYSAVVVQEVLQRRQEPWRWGVQWPAIGRWHDQLRGSSKRILLQLHKKLLKNSMPTILQSFCIQSKLERWKSSISGCLMSWPKIFKNCHFEMLSSILYNNEPFLHRIVACDEKWILFNNQQWPAQWLDQEEAPKHFPKLTYTKKRSWSLCGLLSVWSTTAFWIPEKPLHLRSKLSRSMRSATLAAGIDQQTGPSSSPGHPLTTCHTTSASKVEQIGLCSFASSAIFTWPVIHELQLFQASRHLFAGKMLPQSAGGRNAFQGFTRQINLFLIGKNGLIVMVPILNNKSVFEPSYDYLKFMVWNHNYFFTNLNIMPLS